jgi:hypothetical protein
MIKKETVGKRVYLADDELPANPGEYGRSPIDEKWYSKPPEKGFPTGNLENHQVIEHSTGRITVSPSILVEGQNGKIWHGYLEDGIWIELVN